MNLYRVVLSVYGTTRYAFNVEAESEKDAITNAKNHIVKTIRWPSCLTIEERMRSLSVDKVELKISADNSHMMIPDGLILIDYDGNMIKSFEDYGKCLILITKNLNCIRAVDPRFTLNVARVGSSEYYHSKMPTLGDCIPPSNCAEENTPYIFVLDQDDDIGYYWNDMTGIFNIFEKSGLIKNMIK